MKISTQTRNELAHVSSLIADIPIAMLTTLDRDGALTSRPMCALEMDGSGAIRFMVDARAEFLGRLDTLNVAFSDAARGTFVSLSGRGEVDDNRARIKRLWSSHAKPWFPDGPDSPELALLKFMPDTADYWDGPASGMVRALGRLASLITGRNVEMGEHGSLEGLTPGAPVTTSVRRTNP